MRYEDALSLVRAMMDRGISEEDALNNSAIPSDFVNQIRQELRLDDEVVLLPPTFIVGPDSDPEWLRNIDRSEWYYWKTLRHYLIETKHWPASTVRSIDEASDRVLSYLTHPDTAKFDIRGLVIGYVQSGKTANFTALIAKSADLGYRLVIVLSGVDNGLRLQTQQRLDREIIGVQRSVGSSVPLPPTGKRWHQFTSGELDGDFNPGQANHAVLQGAHPILLVVKKNADVLSRLLSWLSDAPKDSLQNIPTLIVDDEADHASVDTRGSYEPDNTSGDDQENPSRINGLIRLLVQKFRKSAFVAYTATPYANILIPHDQHDPTFRNDLYPKDFILSLPKPQGYIGATDLFQYDEESTSSNLNVIRQIAPSDLAEIEEAQVPGSLEEAIKAFVLAGAARRIRERKDFAATMLVHTSHLTEKQRSLASLIQTRFEELRDEWRYQRADGIVDEFETLWSDDFAPASLVDEVPGFDEIEPHIGSMFESVSVRIVNSETGELLDYDQDPHQKVIAVGGNKLSRGLTLEGLLISYFSRVPSTADTLMQMGRWFGFRRGYVDLTRIYTLPAVIEAFSDLSLIEERLRDDLRVYQDYGITPEQVGMRILQHPTMQITNRLKARHASVIRLSQSYSGQLEQTFKFPFSDTDEIGHILESNLRLTKAFLSSLGSPAGGELRFQWSGIASSDVIAFLEDFQLNEDRPPLSLPLICQYIREQVEHGELVEWDIGIRERRTESESLGTIDFDLPGAEVNLLQRTRIARTDSLGVITSPGDETVGLTESEIADMQSRVEDGRTKNLAARHARAPHRGLLLIYPISRYSRPAEGDSTHRTAIFGSDQVEVMPDIVGIAISFPRSRRDHPIEAYLEGTAGWRPIE